MASRNHIALVLSIILGSTFLALGAGHSAPAGPAASERADAPSHSAPVAATVGQAHAPSTVVPTAASGEGIRVWIVDTTGSFARLLEEVKQVLSDGVPSTRGQWVVLIAMSDRVHVLFNDRVDTDAKEAALCSLIRNLTISPDKGTRLVGALNQAFRIVAQHAKAGAPRSATVWLMSDGFDQDQQGAEQINTTQLPARPTVEVLLAYFQAPTDKGGSKLLAAMMNDPHLAVDVAFPQAAKARIQAALAKPSAPHRESNHPQGWIRWAAGVMAILLLVVLGTRFRKRVAVGAAKAPAWGVRGSRAHKRGSKNEEVPLSQVFGLRVVSGEHAGETLHTEADWMPGLVLRLTSLPQEMVSAAGDEERVVVPEALLRGIGDFDLALYRESDGATWVERAAKGAAAVAVDDRPLKPGKRNRIPVNDHTSLLLGGSLELMASIRYGSAEVVDPSGEDALFAGIVPEVNGGGDEDVFA